MTDKNIKIIGVKSEQMDKIEILVPKKTRELKYLLKIIDECSRHDLSQEAKPKIIFNRYENNNPRINFYNEQTNEELFTIGKFEIGFNPTMPYKVNKESIKPEVAILNDSVGEFLQVKWPNGSYYQLNAKQLFKRLNGHIKFIDHAGININPDLMGKEQFSKFITDVASSSNLVSFPHNKDWLFVIPNGEEKGSLFEIVGDFKYNYAEIQLDIQTDLTPEEAMELFPKPYGHADAIPDTEPYCISVFIYTGWSDTSLRVDIRFLSKNNWHEWLARNGKRIVGDPGGS